MVVSSGQEEGVLTGRSTRGGSGCWKHFISSLSSNYVQVYSLGDNLITRMLTIYVLFCINATLQENGNILIPAIYLEMHPKN